MLRNYLVAALRRLVRDRLYSAVNIFGLAAAFAAVLVMALFIHEELTYDRFVPDYQRIYRMSAVSTPLEGAPMRLDIGNASLAAMLKEQLPEVEMVARLKSIQLGVTQGDVEHMEELYWTDPGFFTLMQLPAFAGNPQTALSRPDGVVITRRIARKYFGRDDVVGQTLTIRRRQTLTVTAVLEDLPVNTHLLGEIFASGLASFSALSIFDAQPPDPSQYMAQVFTYLRVKPGVSAEALDAAVQRFTASRSPDAIRGRFAMHAVPLQGIHLQPAGLGAMKPSGSPQTLRALCIIGALVLAMAAINFVNLMTARGARRTVEVGVRKAAGGSRVQLAVQFIGEALLYVSVALLLGIALAELSLPRLNLLLDWDVHFQYAQHGSLVLALLLVAMLMGVLAATYPAWILSSVRPRTALYGAAQPAGFGLVRRALVAAQFAILIGLIVATFVIQRQTAFALHARLRVPGDQLVMIRTSCSDAFRDGVLRLPGVQSAACSALSLQNISVSMATFLKPEGGSLSLRMTAIDQGLFEIFGLKAIAGRFLSRERLADRLPDDYEKSASFELRSVQPQPVAAVINEAAARRLASTPAAALGKVLRMDGNGGNAVFEVIGVAPDLPVDSIRESVQPTIYYLAPRQYGLLTVRFSGSDLPATLVAIGEVWKRVGDPRPMDLVFVNRYVALLHRDIQRQAAAIGCFSLVALAIACLGLVGLSVSWSERRTREIGIRKAMGATTANVLRVLLWQFSTPVLWANLLAWPVAGLAMHRWLRGFAYHIDLPLWIFPLAGLAAWIIALAAVLGQAVRVARARPAMALRHQ
ncbi:MAG: ABC transporter permease [Pseudomonadota bacterium]